MNDWKEIEMSKVVQISKKSTYFHDFGLTDKSKQMSDNFQRFSAIFYMNPFINNKSSKTLSKTSLESNFESCYTIFIGN